MPYIQNLLIPPCESCSKLPLIHINHSDSQKITIECVHCPFTTTTSLQNFYQSLIRVQEPNPFCGHPSHGSTPAKSYCSNCHEWFCEECLRNHKKTHTIIASNHYLEIDCEKHRKKNEFYCLKCNKHFCSQCFPEHPSHSYKKISEIHDNLKTLDIPGEIEKIKKEYYSYTEIVYNKVLKALKEAMNKIQSYYNENKEKNETLFNFVLALAKSYYVSNYHIYTNIINNCKLKLNKVSNVSGINEILQYLHGDIVTVENSGTSLKMKSIKTIKAHEGTIFSLCKLRGGRLASASGDRTIKIFNISTNQCEMVIAHHHKGVTYVSQLDNGYLISCSEDHMCIIWDISKSNYKLVATLKEHEGTVWKATQISDNRIASCSSDKTIVIYNGAYPYEPITVLSGHKKCVNSFIELKKKGLILSGSYKEKTLRFWNSSTYEFEREINDVESYYSSSLFQLDEERVLVGGRGLITVVNYDRFLVERKIKEEGFEYFNCFMRIKEGGVVCGTGLSGDGEVGYLYLLDDGGFSCIGKVKNAHQEIVTSIVNLGDSLFATGSWDNTIKLWKCNYV